MPRSNILLILLMSFVALLVGYLCVTNMVFAMLAVLSFFVLVLFIIAPTIVIPILLICRSSLDVFTGVGVYLGPVLFNIPAIISMLLFVGGCVFIFIHLFLVRDLQFKRFDMMFLLFISFLSLWVVIGFKNFDTNGFICAREWVRVSSLFMIYILVKYITKI